MQPCDPVVPCLASWPKGIQKHPEAPFCFERLQLSAVYGWFLSSFAESSAFSCLLVSGLQGKAFKEKGDLIGFLLDVPSWNTEGFVFAFVAAGTVTTQNRAAWPLVSITRSANLEIIAECLQTLFRDWGVEAMVIGKCSNSEQGAIKTANYLLVTPLVLAYKRLERNVIEQSKALLNNNHNT